MSNTRQKQEAEFWNGYAVHYDLLINRLGQTYDQIHGFIRENLKQSDCVLEVAAGTGSIALDIAKDVTRVEACDISPEMVRISKDKLEQSGLRNVKFSVQDGYDLQFPDRSFDLVIASNALHVMMFPERALASIARVMKPGAVLVAPTYCHGQSFLSRTVSGIMSLRGFKAYHKWSISELKKFFKNSGFVIAGCRTVSGLIPLVLPKLEKEGVCECVHRSPVSLVFPI